MPPAGYFLYGAERTGNLYGTAARREKRGKVIGLSIPFSFGEQIGRAHTSSPPLIWTGAI